MLVIYAYQDIYAPYELEVTRRTVSVLNARTRLAPGVPGVLRQEARKCRVAGRCKTSQDGSKTGSRPPKFLCGHADAKRSSAPWWSEQSVEMETPR